MASFLLTRSLLTRLAIHEYTPREIPLSQTLPADLKTEWSCAEGEELSAQLLCRVCASSGCTPLRDSVADDCDIMCALRMITDVPVSAEDGLPQYICTGCLARVRSALELRRACEASYLRFRNMLAPLSSAKTTYPYSKHNFKAILHNLKMKRLAAQEKTVKRIIRREKKLKPKIKKEKKIYQKNYRCAPCNLTFSEQSALAAHRARRACTRHPCHVCGQLVLSLRQHVRATHGERDAHACVTCGKRFPIVARLRSHMLVHSDTFPFHCDLCPYKSKHKYYLVMHMRTHTGAKPYACPACPATFVNPSNLNKHKLTHREKQFQCNHCEKSFRTTTALREHRQAAHLNVKHTCRHCGRDFCYKSDLRKHEIRYHDRVKRDYVGGEPAYRRAERLRRAPAAAAAPPAWPEPPPAAPPAALYMYNLTDAYIEHQLAGPTLPVPVHQTTVMLPEMIVKKDDPNFDPNANGFF